jgi:diacylglycerol kinase family enzyme
MKMAVVLNAGAGSLLGQPPREAAGTVRRLLGEAGHDAGVEVAEGRGIVDAVERAAAAGADAVVVGGGDGTVACAANRLAGTGTPLGVLPLGTLNLYARDLDTPLEIEEAIAALAAGEVHPLDVAEVNGRIFLNHSAFGLYPLMVREREAMRARQNLSRQRLSKWPAMAVAVMKSLYRYPMFTVGLDLGSGPIRIVTPALVASNNRYEEGFAAIPRRSRLDSGRLGVYVARHRRPLAMARLMAEMVLGSWQQNEDLDVFETDEMTVTSRRSRLQVANDGELEMMTTPLKYRIRAGALRVLVPRGATLDRLKAAAAERGSSPLDSVPRPA